MIEPIKIADVMGGKSALGYRVDSLGDLAEAVSGGLPKAALRNTARRVFDKPKEATSFVYRVVPEATYKRRTRLTPAESERTERLARVIAHAEFVWDNATDAQEWLRKSHPELDGQAPIQSAMTELGARRVEDLLDRIFYGLPV